MIRFLPDTWRDALWRPVAMAAADGNVYVEIMAPDLRFAMLLALVFVTVVVTLLRRRPVPRVLLGMGLWLLAAFAAWLATTGNGRYFIPALLLVGPLCLALVRWLPVSRGFQLTIAAMLVGVQLWVISDNSPWGWWGFKKWDKEAFEIEVDSPGRDTPATYVTVTNISYSLIAARFHPESRWINISSLPDESEASADVLRAQRLLRESPRLFLIVPTRPDHMTAERLPTAALQGVLDDMLRGQRLALSKPLQCRTLPSAGLAQTALRDSPNADPRLLAKFGFWVCRLHHPVSGNAPVPQDPQVNAVFELVERGCSRFFEPGQKKAHRFEGGWVRYYPQSDLKLFVLDSGEVLYKYWRALNAAPVGTTDRLRAGTPPDCRTIRGRSGLPWERGI